MHLHVSTDRLNNLLKLRERLNNLLKLSKLLKFNLLPIIFSHPTNFWAMVVFQDKITQHHVTREVALSAVFPASRPGVIVHVLAPVKKILHPVAAMSKVHAVLPLALTARIQAGQVKTSFRNNVHGVTTDWRLSTDITTSNTIVVQLAQSNYERCCPFN